MRMRARLQEPQPFEGLSIPGYYGLRPPGPIGGENMRPGSFPLAPGMGGPRYNASLSSSFQSTKPLNPNAPDFASRGGTGTGGAGGPQQAYQSAMFGGAGGRVSFPPAGFGMGNPGLAVQNFGPDYPPPIGTPYSSDIHRLMGYPGPVSVGVANRMSGPPPTQPGLLGSVLLSQPLNNTSLISPRSFTNLDSAGSVVQNHENYCVAGTQHQPHRPLGGGAGGSAGSGGSDDRERKLPRPIGTERALTRRTPAPPLPASGFPPADLGLWGFGNPSAELGGPTPQLSAMNPSSLPPGLSHGDWLTLSGLHPNVTVPAPNSADDSGLSYLQKQGIPQQHHHHQMLQRQLEGMTEAAAESLDMQFSQANNVMNGAAGPNSTPSGFHPGSFLNGLPPPGMPGTMFPGIPVSSTADHVSVEGNVNGMWIGPGNNLKGKVPMPNSLMGEQQLTESGMVRILV